MRQAVCIHQLPELASGGLPAFTVAAHTTMRHELLTALSSQDVDALIINLDDGHALGLLGQIRECKPDLPIVGATSTSELTHVIAAQRAGCTQITSRPVDANDLLVALRLALSVGDEQKGGSFTVFSAAGGVGGTTLACYLALELAQISGRQTALLDLDLAFGGVGLYLDVSAPYTLAHLTSASTVDEHMLSRAAAETRPGLHVFVRAPTIEEALSVDEESLCRIVDHARDVYQYTVFDLPRKIDHVTVHTLGLCDRLIIVSELTVTGLQNAKRFIDAACRESIERDRVEIVVNRYRKGIHACSVETVEDYIGKRPLSVLPNDYQSVRKAIETGEHLPSRSPVRREISRLARQLVGEDKRPSRGRWLSRLALRH